MCIKQNDKNSKIKAANKTRDKHSSRQCDWHICKVFTSTRFVIRWFRSLLISRFSRSQTRSIKRIHLNTNVNRPGHEKYMNGQTHKFTSEKLGLQQKFTATELRKTAGNARWILYMAVSNKNSPREQCTQGWWVASKPKTRTDGRTDEPINSTPTESWQWHKPVTMRDTQWVTYIFLGPQQLANAWTFHKHGLYNMVPLQRSLIKIRAVFTKHGCEYFTEDRQMTDRNDRQTSRSIENNLFRPNGNTSDITRTHHEMR